jgi:hypothetical protein
MEQELSPFDSPSARQLAAWTLSLGADPVYSLFLTLDPHLFALFYAACATAVNPPRSLVPEVPAEGRVVSDKLLSTLKDLQRQFGDRTSGRFAKLYLEGIALFDQMNEDQTQLEQGMKEWLERAELAASETISSEEENVDRLAALLGLSPEEKKLLLFQLNRNAPGFSQLYDILTHSAEGTMVVLGAMLKIAPGKLSNIVSEHGTLVRSGLLAVQERPLMIETPSLHLRATLAEVAHSDEEFIKRFVKPLEPKPSTASLARLDDRDRDVLLRLMRLPVPEEHGLHVLLYGPRSVDKQDMLARLFIEEGLHAHTLVTKNVPPSDIPAWVHIAQCQLEDEDPNAVLVIDRAVDALASRRFSLMTLFGMAELEEPDEDRASDEGLTASLVRCIWLTERGGSLSEKNLGRFIFHCEARPGSRQDRRDRITQVVTEFQLSPELEAHLAQYSLLAERPVRQAARLAELLHGSHEEGKEEREATIKRAVSQAQKVLGRDRTEGLRDSVTGYSLDLLNVTGKFSPEQILKALKKRPKATLCFYGIPGAGKTQLAEYFAVELDLPIIMKKASDILSKWLGESEQHIAAMFEEAEAEGALLFLDEADSFLRDRSLARAEWSVTQVNELLQQLERQNGVFIAATNLFQDIDAAALRRFDFKLEFLPLKPEQSWKMFCNETGFDEKRSSKPEVESLRKQLFAIKNLAPGDFATCKRQANLLMEDEPMTTDVWLEQLAAEAKAKMAGLTRKGLGFGADVG